MVTLARQRLAACGGQPLQNDGCPIRLTAIHFPHAARLARQRPAALRGLPRHRATTTRPIVSNTTDAQIAERKVHADEILALLAGAGSTAVTILQDYHTDDEDSHLLWQENPKLYAAVAERLIQEGHPGAALNLVLEWKALLPTDDDTSDPVPEGYQLRYTLARAAVRGGNLRFGRQLLHPVLVIAEGPEPTIKDMPPRLRVDIVALNGRILKDESREDLTLCAKSAAAYEKAGNILEAKTLPDANTFPLVNAATMWRVAAWAEPKKAKKYIAKAETLAQKVIDRATPVVDARIAANDYWLPATLGEASVIVGKHEDAVKWYVKAIEMARASGRNGDVIAMVTNLLRLEQVGATQKPDWIAKYVGNVIVFSGHMVDSPDRLAKPGARPRFPNSELLIERLAEAIQAKLAELNATVGYCSLACGSDILFAQAMLARKAELHVVLPFAESDFLRKSVDFGLSDDPKMKRWADLFTGVLGQLPEEQKHRATTEPYLGTKELFSFVNSFTQGLAVIRARQQFVTPCALVVLEPDAEEAPGGTLHFQKTWEEAGFKSESINLAEVRKNIPMPRTRVNPRPMPEALGAEQERPIKALLFADVVKFSRLKEADFPLFLRQYTAFLRSVFESPAGSVKGHANTWGDGLHVVFNSVTEVAEFALSLIDRAGKPSSKGGVDWEKFGMPGEVPLRIALHTGPVFKVHGLSDQPVYFGQHVNWAARIEPVTVPGCVYASEQLASLLTMDPQGKKRFLCEFVGIQELPKKSGRCPLYNVTRVRPTRKR